MKNLFLIFAMVPILAIGQISNWRTNPNQQQSTPLLPQRSTTSTQSSTPQKNNVSDWRNNPPRNNDRQPQTTPSSNIVIRDPYWNNGRWDMWVAPNFGWNYFLPSWYLNDWGYRQPSRIYIYDNGKKDTIRGKKPIISFGIQKTTDRQIGGFFTIGNKGYLITEYNSSFERDNSTFFQYGNITQVDFLMVDDLIQKNSFYIGVGKRIKRTGVHLMIGTVSEDVKWRGKDVIGYITFTKYKDRFTTIKIGTIHDYKNFTIKFEYDPIINNGTFGFGVNL